MKLQWDASANKSSGHFRMVIYHLFARMIRTEKSMQLFCKINGDRDRLVYFTKQFSGLGSATLLLGTVSWRVKPHHPSISTAEEIVHTLRIHA